MTLGIQAESLCLCDYSPVRSLASLGLERLCDKVPQFGKTRAFFLMTLGIQTVFSVFEKYSPVRSLASLGLERFCDKVPHFGKFALSFL